MHQSSWNLRCFWIKNFIVIFKIVKFFHYFSCYKTTVYCYIRRYRFSVRKWQIASQKNVFSFLIWTFQLRDVFVQMCKICRLMYSLQFLLLSLWLLMLVVGRLCVRNPAYIKNILVIYLLDRYFPLFSLLAIYLWRSLPIPKHG